MAGALALSACGSGAATSPPTTVKAISGTVPVTSTTLTEAAVSDGVLAGYRNMWADLVVAAATSDFQSPLLSQHATGDALTLLVQGLARDQLHGIVTKGVTAHHPTVTSLSPAADPTHATVTDCFDDTRWIEYTTDGKRAKNTPGWPPRHHRRPGQGGRYVEGEPTHHRSHRDLLNHRSAHAIPIRLRWLL